MTNGTVIFVRLMDEGIDVWRPVRAEELTGSNFMIAEQPYDREAESWEFEPGERVHCSLLDNGDGEFWGATSRAPD